MLKNTTESSSVVSYLDTSITISENKYGNDKRDGFNVHIFHTLIVIFPLGLPMEYIYVSQLVGYVLNIVT